MNQKYPSVHRVREHSDYPGESTIVVSMDSLFAINVPSFFHFPSHVRFSRTFDFNLLPFAFQKGFLIEPQTSSTNKPPMNGVMLQRSNSLTSVTSNVAGDDLSVGNKDGTNNEDYLRICLTCRQVLQRRYDQLCFKNGEKDEVFLSYEVSFSRNGRSLISFFSLENR